MSLKTNGGNAFLIDNLQLEANGTIHGKENQISKDLDEKETPLEELETCSSCDHLRNGDNKEL